MEITMKTDQMEAILSMKHIENEPQNAVNLVNTVITYDT